MPREVEDWDSRPFCYAQDEFHICTLFCPGINILYSGIAGYGLTTSSQRLGMHVGNTKANHPLREKMFFIFQVSAVSIDLEMPGFGLVLLWQLV